MNIKPKKKVVYECYYEGTDVYGNKVKVGSRVKLDFIGLNYYYFVRESGRGYYVILEKENFTKHLIPAAK